MDETYATYVDDGCFDIHDYDDDANDDDADDTTDDTDEETTDDTDDDTDDGGRGNRRPLPGAEFISWMMIFDETLILDFVLSRNRLQ